MAGIGTFKLIKMYQYTVAKDATGNNTETEALRYRTFADVKDREVHLILITVIIS